jgi:hypothetical protein
MTVEDVSPHSRDTRCPGFCKNHDPPERRAQGMPGDGLTHGPPATKKAGGSHHRFSQSTGIPCTMVLTLLRTLPGVHDFISHRRLAGHPARLSASPGAPGPHDFAVRVSRARRTRCPRPSHPAPNTRDDREAPLSRARNGADHGSDLGSKSNKFPKIITATDWHDGQISALCIESRSPLLHNDSDFRPIARYLGLVEVPTAP